MSMTLSIVVNYFNPRQNPRVLSMTALALHHLSDYTTLSREVLLVDGSGQFCEHLRHVCHALGFRYLPAEQRETFAQSYNRGAANSSGEFIVLMANDILVQPEWDVHMVRELRRTGAMMAAPYLSVSDYYTQVRGRPFRHATFCPSFMTFNLNVLTRECWAKVGPMDERFSGCFNDIDYLLRIRDIGGEAIICDAGDIQHLGRATRRAFTTVDDDDDRTAFYEKYPHFARGLRFDGTEPILCRSRLYRALLRATYVFKNPARSRQLRELIARFEPLLHRFDRLHKRPTPAEPAPAPALAATT